MVNPLIIFFLLSINNFVSVTEICIFNFSVELQVLFFFWWIDREGFLRFGVSVYCVCSSKELITVVRMPDIVLADATQASLQSSANAFQS